MMRKMKIRGISRREVQVTLQVRFLVEAVEAEMCQLSPLPFLYLLTWRIVLPLVVFVFPFSPFFPCQLVSSLQVVLLVLFHVQQLLVPFWRKRRIFWKTKQQDGVMNLIV